MVLRRRKIQTVLMAILVIWDIISVFSTKTTLFMYFRASISLLTNLFGKLINASDEKYLLKGINFLLPV